RLVDFAAEDRDAARELRAVERATRLGNERSEPPRRSGERFWRGRSRPATRSTTWLRLQGSRFANCVASYVVRNGNGRTGNGPDSFGESGPFCPSAAVRGSE